MINKTPFHERLEQLNTTHRWGHWSGYLSALKYGMDITIHTTVLPHDDPDASLAFYRDTLGFEVRNDVEYNGLHWITVGPAGQPGTSIVLDRKSVV